MIKIRAFQAIDDPVSCQRFADGHSNVLKDYGVTKVTSAKNDWFDNPDVYVILVESADGLTALGGERIHIANNSHPLPIESAIGIVDTGIHDLVKKHAEYRTGELCGLWNAKSIAGHGVSILLTKLGVSLAMSLQLRSLFVLCAPYTVQMTQMCGFTIETSIGNNGTFYYPKLDLVATSLVINDLINLPYADPDIKKQLSQFCAFPIQSTTEHGPKGEILVEIDLGLKKRNAEN